MIIQSVEKIHTWRYDNVFAEQSSDDIWQACCKVVKKSLKQSNIKADNIKGIGFESNQNMTNYHIRKTQGIFPIDKE